MLVAWTMRLLGGLRTLASGPKTHKSSHKRFYKLPASTRAPGRAQAYSVTLAGRNHNFAKKSNPSRARLRSPTITNAIQSRRLRALFA